MHFSGLHEQNFNITARRALRRASISFLIGAGKGDFFRRCDVCVLCGRRPSAGNRKSGSRSAISGVKSPKPTAYGLIRNVTPIKVLGFLCFSYINVYICFSTEKHSTPVSCYNLKRQIRIIHAPGYNAPKLFSLLSYKVELLFYT